MFIGNADLRMSNLDNYDVRVDYKPYDGGLLSGSIFYKDIEDPIEFVQRVALFDYTTPVNYPAGTLLGFEFEARQDLSQWWEAARGLSAGLNATYIDSEVILPDDEAAGFNAPGIQAPLTKRDATNAPEYLYNIYTTYDIDSTGAQVLHELLDSLSERGVGLSLAWVRTEIRESSRDPMVRRILKEQIGQGRELKDISPRRFASQADAPVLLIHGKDDIVVPFEQSFKMADALKDAGKPHELITLDGEDHWLSRSETRIEMLRATIEFLEQHNPPG